MGRTILMITVASFLLGGTLRAQESGVALPVTPTDKKPPRIQLAVLLDTSSSMQGLINQAKTRLWKIVNEFALAKRGGQTPDLEVAVYEYGRNTLPAKNGHVRLVVGLSTNLDAVSKELHALKATNIANSNEYCGKVILDATQELKWSADNRDLKVIVIAGNETFALGPVDYKDACRNAIEKGILVDTIFCGNYSQGVGLYWQDGARRAEGRYSAINQNLRFAAIAAPQDKEIAELNKKLNETYVPYGRYAARRRALQSNQDRVAEQAGTESVADRAYYKASKLYRQAAWDLVDAIREGVVKLEKLKKEELPKAMQEMNLEQQLAYINGKAKRRAEIQAQIAKLTKARQNFLAVEQEKRAPAATAASRGKSLDKAVIESLREKAEKKGIELRPAEPKKDQPKKDQPKKEEKKQPEKKDN